MCLNVSLETFLEFVLLRFSLCSCCLLIPYWPIDISSYQKALLSLLFNAQEENKQQISSVLRFSTLEKAVPFFLFHFLRSTSFCLPAFYLHALWGFLFWFWFCLFLFPHSYSDGIKKNSGEVEWLLMTYT